MFWFVLWVLAGIAWYLWNKWMESEHNYVGMCSSCYDGWHNNCTHRTPNGSPCRCEQQEHPEDQIRGGMFK